MREQLEKQLKGYIENRDRLVDAMNQLQAEFEKCRDRLIETNGRIQALQELLETMENVSEATENDSESEATSRADSN